MSTVAFRAALVREIEQTMIRLAAPPFRSVGVDENPMNLMRLPTEWSAGYKDGQLDAYAHVLQLIKDDDL